MKIITAEQILKESHGMEFSVPLIIRDYSISVTKTGSNYLVGTAHAKGDIPFKVWAGSTYEKMVGTDFKGKVCLVDLEVNSYQGAKSVIIKGIKETNADMSSLLSTPYNLEVNYENLEKKLKSNLSEGTFQVWSSIMAKYGEHFKKEFAAIKYHDNVLGGLAAHTYKLVTLLDISLKMYPKIRKQFSKDVLFLGIALHDLGKIREYNMGTKSDFYFVDHTTFGVEMVSEFKGDLVETLGEEGYWKVVSIISQHHGEWGTRPRSAEAYFIHCLDKFESSVQNLSDGMDKIEMGQPLYLDGFSLM